MSDEAKLTPEEPQKPAPPPTTKDKGDRTRPVVLYIGIMFAAAMLLLLFSFLMQQRNHEALMESMESVQFVVELERDNQKLEEQVEEIQAKLETSQEELSQLQIDYQAAQEGQALAEQQSAALQFLLEIRHYFDLRQYGDAKEQIESLEASGLAGALPEKALEDEFQAPSQLYQSIVAELND